MSDTNTLYLKNLCTKVKKNELRRSLYSYFSVYGRVLDVVALKTPKMRGQAFVVFRDATCALSALRDCSGKSFYGKPLTPQHAKSTSIALLKYHGQWTDPINKPSVEPVAKRPAEDEEANEEVSDTEEPSVKRARTDTSN